MVKKKGNRPSKQPHKPLKQKAQGRAVPRVASESHAATVPDRLPSPRHSWPAARRSTESTATYRFRNPYNFVPYLPAPTILPGDTDAALLGRFAPPPHDRYIGLTGRVACTLESSTPLFIADSHEVKAESVEGKTDKKHLSYRFFQYEGQDAVPATSLRGMLRSLFEIVTNAPLTVFDGDERLEYRLDPNEARHLKPGIVQSLSNGGTPGEIALCDSAKVGAYYDDDNLNILDGSWRCGDSAYAIIGRTKNNVAKVEVLAADRSALEPLGQPIHEGWLKITGRTIDTKKNEQFFYFRDGLTKTKRVTFDAARESDYNAVLAAQRWRDDFITQVQHETLTRGDLVYVDVNGSDVRIIALVKVARLRYRNPIGALLQDHQHLLPSRDYEQLDIASRVFGWVRDAHQRGPSTSPQREKVAYAGRVRLSHANLTDDGDAGVFDQPMTLAILGEPKPTTSLFYLRKKDGEWSERERTATNAAVSVGYDGLNRLRGRKIYRHHGAALNRQEYERAPDAASRAPIRDHQNRTVRGVRAPGNRFRFTLDFHNLAPVELGALLWVLNASQDEQLHLRLGYGKPLGFGSVKLSVGELELRDAAARYSSLAASGWQRARGKQREEWLYRFEMAMLRAYGKPLRTLENIRALLALLKAPSGAKPLPVHYPRSTPEPQPEGKNFEWFEENKRKSTKAEAGPNYVLPHPSETEEGFPLLGNRP